MWNFKDGGSLKVRFLAKNQHAPKELGMSVHQKLGIILENKVVQKLSLEKNVFNKKWSPKLIFLDEIFF